MKGCDFDGDDATHFQEVEKLSRWADVVVMCMGEKGSWSGENNSHAYIGLPDIQRSLIKRVKSVARETVTVMIPELGKKIRMTTDAKGIAKASMRVGGIKRWSPSTPKLYQR